MVVPIVPVDILRIITGYYAEDKGSLLNLLLVSQDFRRLVEPYIYASVSFLASVMASNFMHSIARDSGCAHYVNSLSLPCNSFQGDHYPLFQSILKSLSNLEDLRVYPSSSPKKNKISELSHPLRRFQTTELATPICTQSICMVYKSLATGFGRL
ncbi:hypothetical protein PTI98_010229 [Pleurotus ostreatus]|nr:hypothetical protein PTI98_010229 [Pleurotus ostreatus]